MVLHAALGKVLRSVGSARGTGGVSLVGMAVRSGGGAAAGRGKEGGGGEAR